MVALNADKLNGALLVSRSGLHLFIIGFVMIAVRALSFE
jgi:hypothetical protein